MTDSKYPGGGRSAAAFAAVLALVASACSAAATPTPIPIASPTTVNVTLQEWGIVPSTSTTPAGKVSFVANNVGPEDVHELVIIKTELPSSGLPTDVNGKVDEAAGGIENLGEIEDVEVGGNGTVTVDLTAGKYVLICNIYDATKKEAHYKQGMLAPFTVQ